MTWHPPHGVKKVRKDHRDYSFQRTFGAIAGAEIPDFDLRTNPYYLRQADLPWGQEACTGVTQFHLGMHEDGRKDLTPEQIVTGVRYTYDRTLEMSFIPKDSPNWENVGCDLRTSLKSTIDYGLDYGDGDPLKHRRGNFFAVEPIAGDWFDSIIQTAFMSKRAVSIATPWFHEFGLTFNNVVTTPKDYDIKRATWHDWEITGKITVNGVPYIIADGWYGYCLLFPREIINMLLTISGSGAFTVVPFTGATITTVKLNVLELALSYLRFMIGLLAH